MNWLDVFLAAMATWRLTLMVINENGPYMIFSKFRTWAGVSVNIETGELNTPTNLSKLITCSFCLSFWVGIGFMEIFFLAPSWLFQTIALPFVLSAITILLGDGGLDE